MRLSTAAKHVLFALFSFAAFAQTPENIRITLMRSGNLGGEPTYRFSIDGQGKLDYEGFANVFARGHRTAHLSKQTMEKLIAAFEDAGFWEFADRYHSA